ncbi:MAG: GNAT family N-acetyltransferase, partial [Micromonosporaceae bacterium]
MTPPDLLPAIEACYDAIARGQARAERYGGLTLFVQDGPGWPLYARPTPGGEPTAEELSAVRERQRALGVPEAFEWVHEVNPGLLELAERDGLSVLQAPLMVLDPAALPAPVDGVRVLDPDDVHYADDVAVCRAIASVGFANPGVAGGAPGAAERDAASGQVDPGQLAHEAARTRAGVQVRALATDPAHGPVATGALLRG